MKKSVYLNQSLILLIEPNIYFRIGRCHDNDFNKLFVKCSKNLDYLECFGAYWVIYCAIMDNNIRVIMDVITLFGRNYTSLSQV